MGEYAFGLMGDGKGRSRDAVENPDEQVTVARIIDLRKSGMPYRTIAGTLDAEGRRPRKGAIVVGDGRAICVPACGDRIDTMVSK